MATSLWDCRRKRKGWPHQTVSQEAVALLALSFFLIMKVECETCDQTLWISPAHTAEEGHTSSQAEHHPSRDFNPSAPQKEQLMEVSLWLVKPSWGGQPSPEDSELCRFQSPDEEEMPYQLLLSLAGNLS